MGGRSRIGGCRPPLLPICPAAIPHTDGAVSASVCTDARQTINCLWAVVSPQTWGEPVNNFVRARVVAGRRTTSGSTCGYVRRPAPMLDAISNSYLITSNPSCNQASNMTTQIDDINRKLHGTQAGAISERK